MRGGPKRRATRRLADSAIVDGRTWLSRITATPESSTRRMQGFLRDIELPLAISRFGRGGCALRPEESLSLRPERRRASPVPFHRVPRSARDGCRASFATSSFLWPSPASGGAVVPYVPRSLPACVLNDDERHQLRSIESPARHATDAGLPSRHRPSFGHPSLRKERLRPMLVGVPSGSDQNSVVSRPVPTSVAGDQQRGARPPGELKTNAALQPAHRQMRSPISPFSTRNRIFGECRWPTPDLKLDRAEGAERAAKC